jgi:hypothetical protein
MKRFVTISLFCCGCLFLQFCTTSRTAASGTPAKAEMATVSYERDVAPIIQGRCAPCHFPDGGKVKHLDTYGAAADNIDYILHRVQLPHDADGFMPFKSKKEPLDADQIKLLADWKAGGMAR